MTPTSQPPNDDLPRDPAFDNAWRALSREEPSSALDAAVRAAARREVGAGPQPATAHGRGVRAPKRISWWGPLAVAATLGAIAVGLVQLVAPDRLGAPGRDGATVSDMPAADAARQTESTKKQAAASASNEVAAPEEKARGEPASEMPAGSSVDRKEAQLQSRESAAPAGRAAPYDELAQRNARKDVSPERSRDAAPAAAPATVEPAKPAPKRIDEPANAPAQNAAPTRAAEPFPAEQAKREEAATQQDAAADAVSARAPAAPAAAGGIAPTVPEAANDKTLAGKPAADYSAASLAKLKTAPAPVTSERGMVGADAAQERREQDAQAPSSVKSVVPAAVPTSATDARVAPRAALSVPDWITLIRRLIAEKNYIAADKELAAFRAAHLDADRVLPRDLRDWHPPR